MIKDLLISPFCLLTCLDKKNCKRFRLRGKSNVLEIGTNRLQFSVADLPIIPVTPV